MQVALLLPSAPQPSAACWPCCMEGPSHLDRYTRTHIHTHIWHLQIHLPVQRHSMTHWLHLFPPVQRDSWALEVNTGYERSPVLQTTTPQSAETLLIDSAVKEKMWSCILLTLQELTFPSNFLFCPFHIKIDGPTWPFRKIIHPPSFSPWLKELAMSGSRCTWGQAGSHTFVPEEQCLHCSGPLL